MTGAALARRGAAAVVLPGAPESVREARAMVRRALGGHHPAAGAAALCVSELATNAIAYTRSGLPGGSFAVSLREVPGGVLIRVADGGARGMPARDGRAPGEHGRGLQIVAALSAGWGTGRAGRGRVTWCLIGDGRRP